MKNERLSKYALANNGDLGKIIKMREYPQIERIGIVINPFDEQYEGLTGERMRKLQFTLDVEFVKENKKLKENKTKFYGFMMKLLTEKGEERIRNHVDNWEHIESTCDPLLLVVTHGMRTNDMSAMESKCAAIKKAIKQTVKDY